MIPDPFVEELRDGVCLSDEEGRILYMNRAARELLGVEAGEETGLRSCYVLCGKLYEPGKTTSCARDCALRDPASDAPGVTFAGRHGPHMVPVWSDGRMHLGERWERLRVRCVRTSGPVWGLPAAPRHFILISEERRA